MFCREAAYLNLRLKLTLGGVKALAGQVARHLVRSLSATR
jgi:hypothetical protein